MLPFKKILCPTDFSEPSYEALKVANELAIQFVSELIVLNVVPPVPIIPAAPNLPASFNIQDYQNELENSSRKKLEDLVKEKIPEKIRVHPMVVIGEPADKIVALAEEEKVDLVVIATHGQTGWRRILFGSVAEKVVRLTPQPVLTIRAPKNEEEK